MNYYLANSTLRPAFLIEAESAEKAQAFADLLAIEGESIRIARTPVEAVADEDSARSAFWARMEGEDFIDNFRTAYADRPAEMATYVRQQEDGCCGNSDQAFLVNGRLFYIGCNYGH